METFSQGDRVKSRRDPHIHGTVIGYGFLDWPFGAVQLPSSFVYLVQTNVSGSSALGPAVAVLHRDQTERE